MLLERANEPSRVIQPILGSEPDFLKWMEHPISVITEHDDLCCKEARHWFLAYARSQEIQAQGELQLISPTWLSGVFEWGPSPWPIAWCEVVRRKVVDCGVLAALAREVFQAQGYQIHGAQALFSYNRNCTGHWQDLWNENVERRPPSKSQTFPWVGEQVVYHELCIVEEDGRGAGLRGVGRVYDSSWGLWYEPFSRIGFGAMLAIRSLCPRPLQWGELSLVHGEWVEL